MLAAALEAEVNAYIVELADEGDEKGRRVVVRNSCHQSRPCLPDHERSQMRMAAAVTVPRKT